MVLALPRGGVPVGFAVAQTLNAPLDTLVTRKIGLPSNPEFGIGAIAPGGVVVIDDSSLAASGLNRIEIEPVIEKETGEMERRILRYKSGQYGRNTPRDTIIVVDDGLATGVTARAAIESVRLQYAPLKLIFAAPVCAHDNTEILRSLVDDVVCLQESDNFVAVGEWYEDFSQTTDEEVIALLEKVKAFHDPKL